MSRINYAAIEIGSNTVRLHIKSISSEAVGKQQFKKILLLRIPFRLGLDIFSDGELSERKARKLERIMKAYRHLMKIYDVRYYRACATSAMRDAKNGTAVIRQIAENSGVNIEIINGREEAHIIYSNHLECVADCHSAYLYVDVSGGSTEINFLCDGILQSPASYNIGTLRLLTGKVRDDEWQRMQLDLETFARRVPHVNIIGSGGNINKIYRMASVKDTISKRLPIDALLRVYNDLKDLTTEQRIERFSLKEDRADVIVPAAEIFLPIANLVHDEFIHVPVFALADGIIDELYEQANRK